MVFQELLSTMIGKKRWCYQDSGRTHPSPQKTSNEVKNSTHYHCDVGCSGIGDNSRGSTTARKHLARDAETTGMRRSFISVCNGMWILSPMSSHGLDSHPQGAKWSHGSSTVFSTLCSQPKPHWLRLASLSADKAGGQFNFTANAAGNQVLSGGGDLCKKNTITLPDGVGTVQFHTLNWSTKAGQMDVKLDLELADSVAN